MRFDKQLVRLRLSRNDMNFAASRIPVMVLFFFLWLEEDNKCEFDLADLTGFSLLEANQL